MEDEHRSLGRCGVLVRPATTKIFFPDQSHQSVEDTQYTHTLSLARFPNNVAQSVFIVVSLTLVCFDLKLK